MVTLVNSFEGGTNGVSLTQGSGGNTGGASGDYFTTVTATAGTIQFSNAAAMVGSRGVAFNNDVSTATSQFVRWSANTVTTAYTRAYVKFPTAIPAATRIFHRAQKTSSNRVLVRMSSAGAITMADSTGTLRYTSTKTFVADEAFRIECHFTFDATNGHMEARLFWGSNINGTTPDETVGNFATSWNLGGVDADFFDWGNLTNTTGETRYMDALGWSDTTWVGPASGTNTPQAIAATTTLGAALNASKSNPKAISAASTLSAGLTAVYIPAGAFNEGAEAGADEADVTTSSTSFDAVDLTVGATFKHDTAIKLGGAKSFRVQLPAGAFDANGRKTATGSPTTRYYRLHLYIPNDTIGSPTRLLRILDSDATNQQIASLEVTIQRHITIRDATDVVVGTSTPYIVPLATWVRIEVRIVCDPVAGVIEARMWNDPYSTGTADSIVISTTADTGSIGIGKSFWGRTRSWAGSAAIGPFWMDDLAAQAGTWVGPITAPSGGSVSVLALNTLPAFTTHAVTQTSGTVIDPGSGPYYVRIVAKDDDVLTAGPAPYSDPAVGGSPHPINHEDLAVDAVWANNIKAGNITAAHFQAMIGLLNVLVAGGSVIDHGDGTFTASGQRVEMSAAGIKFFDSTGANPIELPSDASKPARFEGLITAGGRDFLTEGGLNRVRLQRLPDTPNFTSDNPAVITWTLKKSDPVGAWDGSNQVTLWEDGIFLITIRVAWAQETSGYRQVMLQTHKSGTWAGVTGGIERKDAVSNSTTPLFLVLDYDGSAGEQLRVQGMQHAAGAPLVIQSAFWSTMYLGPG